MRWYCVLCFAASRLKNSTLRLLNASVTFTPSSRKTRSSGAGKKSATTLGFPKGSFVYLILELIDSFALSPIAGAKDANNAGSISKADSKNFAANYAKTEKAFFVHAMGRVLGDNTARIDKRKLRREEVDAVLELILVGLCSIPIEPGIGHMIILRANQT